MWIKRVLRASRQLEQPIEQLTDLLEIRTMLVETVKNWEKTWRAEGIKEGIKEGKAEGVKEGIEKNKLEIAKAMLQKGLDRQIVIEITGLSEEVVSRLIH